MTQALTVPTNIQRLVNAPAFDEEDGDFIAPPRFPQTANARIQLDAAAKVNARNLTPEIAEKRRVPRMSISALNDDIDPERVAMRMKALVGNENRPGIEKFFDLIDAPRNLVVNAATSVFATEAQEYAKDRGDYDQFGQLKVYTSDMLRAMGVKNRIVRGVVGFVGDVALDPLTYLGGVGVIKSVGSQGAKATLSIGRQKQVIDGFRAAAKGKDIADPRIKKVVETYIQTGIERGAIKATDDAATKVAWARKFASGDMGKVSSITSAVRLGGTRKGSQLADDLGMVVDGTIRERATKRVLDAAGGTQGVAAPAVSDISGVGVRFADDVADGTATLTDIDRARITAVKEFFQENTVARGLDLTGGKGGAQLLHLPFTGVALTVPEFTVPLLGYQAGRNQVVQQAMSAALRGDVVVGQRIMQSMAAVEKAENLRRGVADSTESIRLAEWQRDSQRAKVAEDGIPSDVNQLESEVTALRGEWLNAARERAAVANRNPDAIEDVTGVAGADRRGRAVNPAVRLIDEEQSLVAQRAQIDRQIAQAQAQKAEAANIKPDDMVVFRDDTQGMVIDAADGMFMVRVGDKTVTVPASEIRKLRQSDELELMNAAPRFEDYDATIAALNQQRSQLQATLSETRYAVDAEVAKVLGPLDDNLEAIRAKGNLYRETMEQLVEAEDVVSAERLIQAKQVEELEALRIERQRSMNIAAGGPDLDQPMPLNASVGDVLLMGMLRREAMMNNQIATDTARWADTKDMVARVTRGDVAVAKKLQRDALNTAKARGLIEATATYDDMLRLGDRAAGVDGDELRAIIQYHKEIADNHYRELIELNASDIALRERVADSFQDVVGATAELARLRGASLRSMMSSSDKMLARTAAEIWGIGDTETGFHIFGPAETLLRKMHADMMADKVAQVSYYVGRNFGQPKTVQGQVVAGIRTTARSQQEASSLALRFERATMERDGFKGIGTIANEHGLPSRYKATLYTMAHYANEAEYLARAGGKVRPIRITKNSRFAADQQMIAEMIDKVGPEAAAQIAADLKVFAARYLDANAQMAAAAAARGDLSMLNAPYLSLTMTPEAMTAFRNTKAARGTADSLTPGKVVEDFAMNPGKARITNVVETDDGYFLLMQAETILDPLYVEKRASLMANKQALVNSPVQAELVRLLEAEDLIRKWLEKNTAYTIDNAGQLWFRDTQTGDLLRAAKSYDAPLERLRDSSRAIMPSEANELASAGFFDDMIGNRLSDPRTMWEMNPIIAMQRRAAAASSDAALSELTESLAPYIMGVRPVANMDTSVRGKGAYETSNRQMVTYLGSDGGMRRFEIDGQLYREVDASRFTGRAAQLFGPDLDLFGTANKGVQGERGIAMFPVLPDDLSVQVERMMDLISDDQKLGVILGGAAAVNTAWKTSTLMHPSWTVTTVIGNMFNIAIHNPDILLNPKRMAKLVSYHTQMMRALMHHHSGKKWAGDGSRINIDGSFVSTESLMRTMDQERITGASLPWETNKQMLNMLSDAGVSGSGIRTKGLGKYERVAGRRGFEKAMAAKGKDRLSPSAQRVLQVRENAFAWANLGGPVPKAIDTFFKINGSLDDMSRGALMLLFMDDGMDAVSAADKVRRQMLNFGDLSRVESKYMRNIFPFYSWMRASLPKFLNATVTDPKLVAMAPKLKQALEEAAAGDGAVPRHMRPDWLRQTAAIQVGTDPEKAKSFLFSTLLPQEGAMEFASGALGLTGLGGFDGGDFMDAINWLGGQTSPAIKMPIELGAKRELFTGRSIGAKEGQGDISMSGYLAGQIRWAREFGVGQSSPGGLQRAFGQGPVDGVGRLLIGGRLGSDQFSTEGRQRGLRFAMKDRENEIKKAISRADRRADAKSMANLRIDLLELYQDHLIRGGAEQDVPRWARTELEAMRTTPIQEPTVN